MIIIVDAWKPHKDFSLLGKPDDKRNHNSQQED